METAHLKEQRNDARRNLDTSAIVRFGTKFTGRGLVKNISSSGIYIENINFLRMLSPTTVRNMRGFPVKIKPVDNTIYIDGKIAWANYEKGCLGISIISVSSDETWQQMLSEASIVL